jgi:hypothetical protein
MENDFKECLGLQAKHISDVIESAVSFVNAMRIPAVVYSREGKFTWETLIELTEGDYVDSRKWNGCGILVDLDGISIIGDR